jgi:hypothetical protein
MLPMSFQSKTWNLLHHNAIPLLELRQNFLVRSWGKREAIET